MNLSTFSHCLGRRAAAATFTALVLAAPALALSTPTDAWITTKVKLALATTDGVSAADVNVDTVTLQVTLHGTVHTAAEKETAERVAKSVDGVQAVRNLVQVVPPGKEAAVEEKDEEIERRVSEALAADSSLKESSIAVQSVNKGVVLLKGTAKSMNDHLTAVQAARDVKGVRRVASEVQSPDALADAGVWKERNIAVGGTASQSVRGATTDLYTTSLVKLRLLAEYETPAMEINVDTRNGVVTLFGIIGTEHGKSVAEAEARKVGGVTSVRNQLQVVPRAEQPAVAAKDDAIQSAVARNLGQHPELGDVTSEVKNCIARLTGTVPSGTDRVEAMQVARATKGVCSVKDGLTVQ